ncbi:hypothetical protein [Saccharothrix sp. ST-888]|uniref:hypothetical protein n=1 Tax=Saccharothrix sp. ST-888 TaxID=1427391 RepID=UPI0005EC9033|nr:hypothetical protein [Saccharothrix sp. ST-888]KJK59439.1 hypothetical protein UK12_04360 [Saccharothrix sp. ST-888]
MSGTVARGNVRRGPGRMHDQTAMCTEGVAGQLRLHPKAIVEIDDGYRGLANELHDLAHYPGARPEQVFGEGRLDTPWKEHQYEALDGEERAQFRERSRKPYNWFILAACHLRDTPAAGVCTVRQAAGT